MSAVTVIFDNLGPYHIARLDALNRICDLTVIELHAVSSEYDWLPTGTVPFRRVTLDSSNKGKHVGANTLMKALEASQPDAVFIPGWSSKAAIQALLWARKRRVPAILMSDSQASDFIRNPAVEWLKSAIVRNFSGALVAGKSHRDYACHLGISPDLIRTCYDVVDNDHFANGADVARKNKVNLRHALNLPKRFFLASARFIEKKNLPFLIEAYSAFHESRAGADIDLVIIGNGPLRSQLEALVLKLGLQRAVHLPGFVQYSDTPKYYGLATAFILPSTTDQWGLVVNEAMAAGLPVLVSERCGAAVDLVRPGKNGFTFDPHNMNALAALMRRLADSPHEELVQMGTASRDHIADYSPECFATAAAELAHIVSGNSQCSATLAQKLLLSIVCKLRRTP